MKALLLLSGGLDSILAGRLMQEEDIEVEAINFVTCFCTCTSKNSCKSAAVKAADDLKIPLKMLNVTMEYLEIVKNPEHGYGSNMNPCIDCRIFMLKKAKVYMEEIGARFIVTGEVLGERPMSQRRDAMHLIEREAGLKGLILRPLSAKLMDETIPEKRGWIDRERLLAISGRSRQPQMELAEQLKVYDYPCPGGGCLLTDPQFGDRMRDLMKHDEINIENIYLLKAGRHFRMAPKVKLIVGRDESENQRIANMGSESDLRMKAESFPGPLSLLRTSDGLDEELIKRAASITARYGKGRKEPKVRVIYWKGEEGAKEVIVVEPCGEEYLDDIRV